jgi:hypothetical protein
VEEWRFLKSRNKMSIRAKSMDDKVMVIAKKNTARMELRQNL